MAQREPKTCAHCGGPLPARPAADRDDPFCNDCLRSYPIPPPAREPDRSG